MAGETMVLLEKIVVPAAGASSVTFTSIPQSYTDLQITMSSRVDAANGVAQLYFNGSTASDKRWLRVYGDGSSAVSGNSSGLSAYFRPIGMNRSDQTASVFGNMSIYIPNYTSSSTYKSMSADGVNENNATFAEAALNAGLWESNSAITSITIIPSAGNFVQYSTFYLYGVAKQGVTPTNAPAATGGDSIVFDGTYWIHTFYSSGTFTPKKALTCDYLVVAGGGGAGQISGGGGAGGLRSTVTTTGGGGSLETALSLLSNNNYTITVGAGGANGTNVSANSPSGSNSSISGTGISTITSTGGGGGNNYNSSVATSTGGSGGGGNRQLATAGGAGTANQGYAGGTGGGFSGGSDIYSGAGGGGGAGAVGGDYSGTTSGSGGSGVAVSISGSSVTYAGGGGGGAYQGTAGTGGSGGGGNGVAGLGQTGGSGTANRGSGGGGGSAGGGVGGSGGSGIVIVRYAA